MKNVVAILGAGRIARVHAEALVRFQRDVRIKYIIDPYLTEEARQWAGRIGIENTGVDANCVYLLTDTNALHLYHEGLRNR